MAELAEPTPLTQEEIDDYMGNIYNNATFLSRIIEDLVATRVADEKEFAAELQAAMTSRTSPTSPKNGGNGEVITEVPVETVEVETTDFFGDPFKQGDSASI